MQYVTAYKQADVIGEAERCPAAALVSFVGGFRSAFEKKIYAPESAEADQRIYDSADYRALTAEYPGDKIKLEKTDKAPVDCADNNKYK